MIVTRCPSLLNLSLVAKFQFSNAIILVERISIFVFDFAREGKINVFE